MPPKSMKAMVRPTLESVDAFITVNPSGQNSGNPSWTAASTPPSVEADGNLESATLSMTPRQMTRPLSRGAPLPSTAART
jgi:hypothetical protein